MRVIVDMDLCEGHGVCMGIAPEIFEVDDDLVLHLLQETPPEDLRELVRQAVVSCPAQAISLQDE